MAAQTDNKAPYVVVHGGADSFKQEITVGEHGLVADEPVSAGGTTICWRVSASAPP